MKHPYTHEQRKNATFIVILLLFLFLLYTLRGFITSFFGAIIIYTLFRSWHLKLVEQKNWKSMRSATLMMTISLFMIILPVGFMVFQAANEIVYLTKNPAVITKTIEKLQNNTLYKQYADPKLLQDQASRAGQIALDLFTSILNGLANSVASVGVMYLMLFFMFADYDKMEKWLTKYFPFSGRNTSRFAEELKTITSSNVIGTGILSLIQGALVGLGFWIFGIPQPFLYGSIAVFAAFLPVVGSALVFVPGSIYAFLDGNNLGGFGMLAWGFLIVANADNVIRILINKRLGDTHPLITFLGIIVGVPIFGLTGLVIGPLVLALFVLSVRIYTQNYLYEPEEEQPVTPIIVVPTSEVPSNG
ncbi:MAG: AI-2E family transporter [Verrucomicrobia bacterium]|nr:AI-2E family transporter [Cytophagales bacterium]